MTGFSGCATIPGMKRARVRWFSDAVMLEVDVDKKAMFMAMLTPDEATTLVDDLLALLKPAEPPEELPENVTLIKP